MSHPLNSSVSSDMKQLNAKIVYNKAIATDIYRMRIGSGYLAKSSKPGQFVEVRCSDGLEALLRRPLGVHRIVKGGVELLYEVVGKGTGALSRRRSGEDLDVIGPLGNGFDTSHITHHTSHILVAGGIGAAPLLGLAEFLARSSELEARREKKKIFVLLGACKKSHILCEREFERLGAKVLISTDDGSYGRKGMITDVLKNLLSASSLELSVIYTCGPHGMLKEAAAIARHRHIPCQVSLEERMACGVGACLGCPVKVKTVHGTRYTVHEYKMVCKDGPVFDAEEIVW